MKNNVYLRCGKCNTLLAIAFLASDWEKFKQDQSSAQFILFECPNKEHEGDGHTEVMIDLEKLRA